MTESGVVVGTMRWGKWGAKRDRAGYLELIHASLDAGLNVFDLADIYGDHTTEHEFGEALKAEPGLRSRLHLVTKCGIIQPPSDDPDSLVKHYNSSAEHIRQSVENSLQRLHTDHLDVLLIHRPDYLLEPSEVGEEIAALKGEGKVGSFGLSNFSVSQVQLVQQVCQVDFHQFEASIIHRVALDDGRLDQCQQLGIRPMAWAPLGGGALFGDEGYPRVLQALSIVGKRYGISPTATALAWLMRHPAGILPVIGSSRPERIEEAATGCGVELSREAWYEILKSARGKDVD